MSRWLMVLGGVLLLSLLTVRVASADDPPGARLFSTYCAACHGVAGKGGYAPAIGSDAYLGKTKDEEITNVTADGEAAKGMPAWSKAKGGLLSDEQIQDIVAYLRSQSPAGAATASVATPIPTAAPVVESVQTVLALTQDATSDGQTVVIALLKESDGDPVAAVTVTFSRQTLFGPLMLGTAKTDKTGTARLTLAGIPENSEVSAVFRADKNWQAAQAILKLDKSLVTANTGTISVRNVNLDIDEPLLAPDGSLVTPNPPLIPATLFLLVVAGVWSIYLYVISQIIGIWRSRPNTVRENQLRMRTR